MTPIIRNKSTNHHNPQPQKVTSLSKPKTISPIIKRSIPNTPKKKEIKKRFVGSLDSLSYAQAIKKVARSSLASLLTRINGPASLS